MALSCICVLSSTDVVRANGAELMPGGTRSVARGGAVAARPEDPMTLLHNPAGLAFLSGQNVMLNLDMPFHEMCFDPYGYYGWGIYDDDLSEFGDPLSLDEDNGEEPYATTPLPEVCNSGRTLFIPQLAWAGEITDHLVLGGGFVAPTVLAGAQWGGADGTIVVDDRTFPTPTRYQMIKQEAERALAINIGAGYRIVPEFAIGVTVQIAMLKVKSTAVQNQQPGTQPSSDWFAELTVSDYFLPSVTLSAHARPLPNLDVMAGFRWVDDFSGSGEGRYRTNTYNEGVQNGPVPAQNEPFDIGDIEVPLPWALTLGVRYAGLLPDAKPEGDPMERELWDVELDLGYSLNARASENKVEPKGDVTVITREAIDGEIESETLTVREEDLSSFSIDRHQTDSLAVRLGGSFSVVPRKFAVDAGAFFETRGIEPEYASIDSFAFQRIGMGLGVTARLGVFDLFAGYTHIFSEDLVVATPDHENAEDGDRDNPTSGFDKRVGGTLEDGVRTGGMVLEDPDEPSTADAVAELQQSAAITTQNSLPERVINAGKYTASFNIISIGAVYHF